MRALSARFLRLLPISSLLPDEQQTIFPYYIRWKRLPRSKPDKSNDRFLYRQREHRPALPDFGFVLMLLVLVTGRRFPETHAICDACRASPLNFLFRWQSY
jgi:hypothetical protein